MPNKEREDQLPWTKWFWADYEAELGLRLCSLAAQGLWMRMLSFMAKSQKKGYLLDGNKQMSSKTLARATGETEDTISALILELFDHGVPSKTEDGTIFNRRMVRDAAIHKSRSDAGRAGGKAKAEASLFPSKTLANHLANTLAPSASASASDSDSFQEGEPEGEPDQEPKPKETKRIRLILDDEGGKKRWEGITPQDIELWKKAYPGVDIEAELAEMIAYWDAQPPAKRKINWKATIANRMKYLQDHPAPATRQRWGYEAKEEARRRELMVGRHQPDPNGPNSPRAAKERAEKVVREFTTKAPAELAGLYGRAAGILAGPRTADTDSELSAIDSEISRYAAAWATENIQGLKALPETALALKGRDKLGLPWVEIFNY